MIVRGACIAFVACLLTPLHGFSTPSPLFIKEERRQKQAAFLPSNTPNVRFPSRLHAKMNLTPAQRLKEQDSLDQQETGFVLEKLKDIVYSVSESLAQIADPKEAKSGSRITETADRLVTNFNQQSANPAEEKTSSSASLFGNVKKASYSPPSVDKPVDTKPIDLIESQHKAPIEVGGVAQNKQLENISSELKSKNPISRAKSQVHALKEKVRQDVLERKRRVTALLDGIKKAFYSFIDDIKRVYQFLVSLPEIIARLIDQVIAFVTAVPVVVEETIDQIAAIPEKVEQKTAEIKTSVEETVNTTKYVVNEVKAIPQRVRQTAKSTQETAMNTAKKMEELQFEAKVLFGMEEPRPKTPSSDLLKSDSPKSKDAADILMDLSVGAGKFVWWATKGVADAALQAAGTSESKQATERTVPANPQLGQEVTKEAGSVRTSIENDAAKVLLAAEEVLKAPISPNKRSPRAPSMEDFAAAANTTNSAPGREDDIAEALREVEGAVDEANQNPSSFLKGRKP